jgi:hypothetical protein
MGLSNDFITFTESEKEEATKTDELSLLLDSNNCSSVSTLRQRLMRVLALESPVWKLPAIGTIVLVSGKREIPLANAFLL